MKLFSLIGLLLMYLPINCHKNIETPSRIMVDGSRFVDDKGETKTFNGLNTSDPDKLVDDGLWTQVYFDEMKIWGANLVRFPIHPSAWRKRGAEAYMKILDNGIAMAKKAGQYVILDWHSIGNLKTGLYQHERYNTSKEETFEFWKMMSIRYGNNPTVAFFEFFNEPTTIRGELGDITWPEWKLMMEELIEMTRSHGAKAIPLVAGFNWAYDLTEVMDDPVQAEGVAYVSHPYPMKREKPWAEAWTKDWGHVAKEYPVLLTEVGFCAEDERGAHIPVIDDGAYPKAITDYADSIGVSYVVWVFDKQWSPHLYEDDEYTPSKAGKAWKQILQNKN